MSFELLEQLRVAVDPDQQLVVTLCALDDPRLVPRLVEILLDVGAATNVRRTCGEILREVRNAELPSDETLRGWWASDDDVLRRHALLQMSNGQRDIVDSVLDDATHPHYPSAIETLAFGFSSAATADRLIAALQDTRPRVRCAAATALVWDEPISACSPLLERCGDPESEVVVNALDTLCYYPTLDTVRMADSLREHPHSEVRLAAVNCLREVRHAILLELSDRSQETHLRGWLSPVWDVLDIDEGEIREMREPPAVLPRDRSLQAYPWMSSPADFAAYFGQRDAGCRERESELARADWSAIDPSQREGFGEQLLHSPDALIRECGARVFVAWNDRGRMLALQADPCFSVRKTAMYYLRQLGPDPVLADYAWSHLPDACSTHSYETLETAIALSEPGSWWQRVGTIVADETMEEATRFPAIHALGKAGARDIIAANLELLLRPPVLTWSVHEALVEWALEFELPLPELSHLADVDHLAVQAMLASLDSD